MTRTAAWLLAALIALSAAAEARPPDPARGRMLAVEACSACHKVTRQQRQPDAVTDPDSGDRVLAPPFTAIAKRYGSDTESLRAFIILPNHPMREQTFLETDLSDIVAYIRSLARHPRRH